MALPRLLAAFLLCTPAALAGDAGKVRETYGVIVANSKARSPAYREVETLFPSSFVAADYEELTRLLILDGLDLVHLGDAGLTYKWSAIHAALYKLSVVPEGGHSLVRLLEDERLGWDAGESLTLCDAMLKRGSEMLPLLARVSARNAEWARHCSELIAAGHRTAF
jgi:hypothetical protein